MTTLERLQQLNRRDTFALDHLCVIWNSRRKRERVRRVMAKVEKLRTRTWNHYMERQPRQNANADEAR
jgi:hypothetical protein